MSTPTCSGRYPSSSEGQGFPAVDNYDYPGNIPVRGIDNREFTWEEVTTNPGYAYQEATSNGGLGNSFVADESPTNVTGRNYITDPTNLSNSSYTGWTVTGSSTVYIGVSGVQITSGQLEGFTGSLVANPIGGNESIGLFPEPGSDSDRPQIISDAIANTEGGIIPDNRHQLYTMAKHVYGESSSVKCYLAGYVASTPVAYYDPSTSSWLSSPPDYAFPVALSGYTEIQYEFTTSTYPGQTPTSFRVVVESYSTGSFLVVDDIHVDAILREDPYSSYSLPQGYILEFTPDLGWHDKVSLFDSKGLDTNPHLKSLGIFTTARGNLNDNLDNSVTATLDATELDEVTSDTYRKYLWRAIAVSNTGELGVAGLPQSFTYIGSDLNDLFTVDSVDSSQTTIVKTIVGSKSDRMSVLVNGDLDYPGIKYPSTVSWRLTYTLNSPKEVVTLQAKDIGGAYTSERYVELSSKLYSTNYQALWNVFDEHGLVADTERLPLENNADYADRIKDAYINRGGAFFEGIVNGATRELGLKKISDGLTISTYTEQGRTVHDNVVFELTAYSARVRTSQTIYEETVYVDPVYHTVDLKYRPADLPISALVEDKDAVPPDLISIEDTDNDPYRYRFVLNYPQAFGRYVTVRYRFSHELLFKEYKTIGSLVSQLKDLESFGKKILKIDMSSKFSGNEAPFGLYLTSANLSADLSILVPWSPVYLNKMADRGFREYFLKNGTYRESKYYEYVKELQRNTRVFWGSVEADRDVWDAADSKDLSFDTIPTLFDPPLAQFQTMKDGLASELEAVSAWGQNYSGYNNEFIVNIGLTNTLFQPGVGRKADLQPEIFTDYRLTNTREEFFGSISENRYNNTTGLFTGQI